MRKLLTVLFMATSIGNAFADSETIFQQPNETDVATDRHAFFGIPDQSPPPFFRTGQSGAMQPWTTFSVPSPAAQYQHSIDPNWISATGAQAAGDTVAINLHSASITPYISARGGLGTYLYGPSNLNVFPFRFANRTIRLTYQMKAPYFYKYDNNANRSSQGEMVAYLILRDSTTGRWFYYGAGAYRSIPQNDNFEAIGIDDHAGGAGMYFAQTTHGYASTFGTSDTNSTQLQNTTFSDFKTFTVEFNATHLANVILALRRKGSIHPWSDNPAVYQITHVYMNPEIYVPVNKNGTLESFVHLATAYRGIRLSIEDAPVTNYGYSVNRVHRYYSWANNNHLFSLGATYSPSTYAKETGGSFFTLAEPGAGRRLLYRCLVNGKPFLSTDLSCEGQYNPSDEQQKMLGTVGYIHTSPQWYAGTALYRCKRDAGYLAVVNPSECTGNGFVVEGVLGYVP